ncbi:MAG: hypothetical protein P3M74_00035 [Candidatus Hodgkinia cicadicola]|nr:MAG: hypothetical protein P3M74_00035 [Candidatus Hodgkinia cicadicola]
MIVSVNSNQYRSSNCGLVKLANTNIKHDSIIIGRVISFRCGNEIFYNNSNSKWLALIKTIGQKKEKKQLGMKFKRRKGHKRTANASGASGVVQITKIMCCG